MALWSRFFGSAGSQAAGVAIGSTAVPALLPAAQFLVNEAWNTYPDRVLREVQLAQGVASGQIDRDWATQEARLNGLNGDRFGRLVNVFDAGPGMASAFEMWRRELITEEQFRRALKRDAIEPEWIDALVGLRHVLISAPELAAMRQRGYIDAAYQHREAGLQGVTPERADLQFENSGLPPGYGELAQMLHRGIVNEAEFRQAVREGNVKTKYTDEFLQLSQPILSAVQAATLRLKGWITEAEAAHLGALNGYSAEQMQQLFLMQGRPMAPVQMFSAWAREAPGPQGGTFDKADFLRAVKQSDIRPEYGETLWALRWAYPSLFQLRRLAEDGTLTRAELLDILHKERYEPTLAVKIVDGWLRGGGATSKGLTAADLAAEYEGRYLTRTQYLAGLRELGYDDATASAKADAIDAKRSREARNQLIGRIHSQYVAHRISRDRAVEALTAAEVPARVRNTVLPDWDLERELVADALTPAQIKKAYTHGALTRDVAVQRLEWRGYDAPDAALYLDQ